MLVDVMGEETTFGTSEVAEAVASKDAKSEEVVVSPVEVATKANFEKEKKSESMNRLSLTYIHASGYTKVRYLLHGRILVPAKSGYSRRRCVSPASKLASRLIRSATAR